MAQVIECLPSKCKALSSNLNTTKKKKREEEEMHTKSWTQSQIWSPTVSENIPALALSLPLNPIAGAQNHMHKTPQV
jgi:hypothetical protein